MQISLRALDNMFLMHQTVFLDMGSMDNKNRPARSSRFEAHSGLSNTFDLAGAGASRTIRWISVRFSALLDPSIQDCLILNPGNPPQNFRSRTPAIGRSLL